MSHPVITLNKSQFPPSFHPSSQFSPSYRNAEYKLKFYFWILHMNSYTSIRSTPTFPLVLLSSPFSSHNHFFFFSLSPITAVHMNMCVRPPLKHGQPTRNQPLKKTDSLTFPWQLSPANSFSARGVASCALLPPSWGVHWLDFVWTTPAAVSSWVQW